MGFKCSAYGAYGAGMISREELAEEVRRGNLAVITEIQKFSLHDGPGIRTTVFFKGCPLRCKWCQNPETFHLFPECFYKPGECIGCMACASVCETGAISVVGGMPATDREKCSACGNCAAVCKPKARQIVGEIVAVDEVADRAMRDKVFFDNSGGGVTLSGGEVMAQAGFAARLLKKLKEMGANTAIETSAHANWEGFEAVLGHTDLVLCDIKHADPSKHKEYTGVGNELILGNLKKLCGRGSRAIARYPLVPDVNDDEQTIRNICEICIGNGIEALHILPFHQAGEPKWEGLGLEYFFKGKQGMGAQAANRAKAVCESMGLKASLGGSGG